MNRSSILILAFLAGIFSLHFSFYNDHRHTPGVPLAWTTPGTALSGLERSSVVIQGFDNEADASGSDQLTLLVLQSLTNGDFFSLTNAIYYDAGYWAGSRGAPISAQRIEYTGDDTIRVGDNICLELPNKDEGQSVLIETILINGSNASSDFRVSIDGPNLHPNISLSDSGAAHLYVYQGTFYDADAGMQLFGTVVDGMVLGMTETALAQQGIPPGLEGRDLVRSEQNGSLYGLFTPSDCDACIIRDESGQIIFWVVTNADERNDIVDNGKCIVLCPPDCAGSLMVSVTDCKIDVEGDLPCDTVTTYEWQQLQGSDFVTISSGSTEPTTFDPGQDGIYQLVITCDDGCTYTSNQVEVACDGCSSIVSVDIDGCTLTSAVTNCPNATFQWQEEGPSGFSDVPGATNSTYDPPSDGVFRVLISGCDSCSTLTSPTLPVTCAPQGCPVSISMEITDSCTIIAAWQGCTELYAASWSFASLSGGSQDCSQAGTYSDGGVEFIAGANYSNGSGFWEVRPLVGAGCYRFELGCFDCPSAVEAELFWDICCNDNVTTSLQPQSTQSCDYCIAPWYIINTDMEELEEIRVILPDGNGSITNLSSEAGFDFPYCMHGSVVMNNCTLNNDLDDLEDDLINWFIASGYQGEVQYAGFNDCNPPDCDDPTCVDADQTCDPYCRGPILVIKNGNVDFVDATIHGVNDDGSVEDATVSFNSYNCTTQSTGDVVFDVAVDCGPGATFTWSSGETTSSITVPENTGIYTVTVTCTNTCTYIESFDSDSGASSSRQTAADEGPLSGAEPFTLDPAVATPEISSGDKRIDVYPNPADRAFKVVIQSPTAHAGELILRDIHGRLVHRKRLEVQVGTTEVTMSTLPFASGTYILQWSGDPGYEAKLIYVQK